jgi:uncharacterized membrane protein YeiB
MWIGLAIGLPGSIFSVWAMLEAGAPSPSFLSAAAILVATFANPALSAFYVSALILLFHRPAWRGRLEPLRNSGRMALIKYLMQSLLILLFHRPAWRARLEPLRNAGRMALTNYLMQSVIATTIFYSHGLGYFGKIGPRWLPLIVLAVYFLELLWSTYWMKRFRFGPAEWLWRTLTYGKRQPMRFTATTGAAGRA